MTDILEILYNQQTKFLETDYEKLYALIRTRITQRSLLVLFTNFESCRDFNGNFLISAVLPEITCYWWSFLKTRNCRN